MNISPGSVLLLNVGVLEAVLTRCREIEPEHLFNALCKICDLSREELEKMVKAPAEALDKIEEEFASVDVLLRECSADTTQIRRRLRRLIGKETAMQGAFTQHRSQRCRDVCQEAESRALTMGELPAQPIHFLWALLSEGSPLIRQAIGEADARWTFLCEKCDVVPATATDAETTKRKPAPEGLRPPEEKVSPPGRTKSRTPFLDKFGRDLSAMAKDGKVTPCIGRRDEMRAVVQILQRKTKNVPVLVGDAGVGKTCVVEGLAQRAAQHNAPDMIRNWRIVEITMGSLMAGAMYQGVLEQRLQTMIKEAQSDPNLILFIDEIHTMVGAGGGHGKGMDAAQILKPAMARGEIRLIGATTTAEYRKYIESDAAFERRMQMVWVNEPTREECIEILDGVRSQLEEHHGVLISYDAIVRAVEWSMRYLPDHRLPDKALDIVDQACSSQIMKTLSPPEDLEEVTHDMAGESPESITEEDIARVISERCQIPIGAIAADDAERLLRMEEVLTERVIDQEEAIKEVADAVRTARVGLKKPNRPVGVFLFLGPTGTGKTELAKALAEFLFGSEEALIRFDMSEYREKHNVSRLVGAPPGYVGHDEEGQLTGRVRTHPYSVILFDEIEKAHPDVFDIFLQIFDDGRLTDSKGRRAMFTESIIVMTSNLGVTEGVSAPKKGFGVDIGSAAEPAVEKASDSDVDRAARDRRIQEALTETFRPELLNRIDRKIVFAPLSRGAVMKILEKLIRDMNERLKSQDIVCEFSAEVKGLLLKEGYSDTYGARELERVFDRRIATPLARAMMEERVHSGQHVRVELQQGEIQFA